MRNCAIFCVCRPVKGEGDGGGGRGEGGGGGKACGVQTEFCTGGPATLAPLQADLQATSA